MQKLTKVEAIIEVLKDNNGIANWKIVYDEIVTYYPNIMKGKDWKSALRGVLYRELDKNKNFKKIDEGIFSLIEYDENNLLLDNNFIDKTLITQQKSFVETRRKQDILRKKAIKELKLCPFTKINSEKLLITSHIKPWVFSNNNERLDLNNVFIFSPLYDKLFDKGLISFNNDKSLLISKELSKYNREKIDIFEGQIILDLPIKNREKYLDFHRNKVFLG